jgi:predicted  nucleic acid-binding Zn-ribbon protein
MSNRETYIKQMKHQLDELNEKMKTLETKAQEVKQDARQLYQEEMRKLRHQSKVAGEKLDEMKTATGETWETMVAEMDKVRDAFTHAFHYFKSQI